MHTEVIFLVKLAGPIPTGLRIALASHYLRQYRNIILWGTGINRTPVKFDALYTDLQYVQIHRSASDLEGRDLNHYTEMLVLVFKMPFTKECFDLL